MKDIATIRSIENRELTKSMQYLLGICMGIIADNEIRDQELLYLSTWLSEYSEVTYNWPGNIISDRVKQILADKLITEEEKAHLLDTLKQLTGNYFSETGSAQNELTNIEYSLNHSIIFPGKLFCFTGEFITGTRAYCKKITESLGGISKDNISKNLDYLIIGTLTSQQWKHMSFGNKIEAAIKLKEENALPHLISENQWVDAIKTTR